MPIEFCRLRGHELPFAFLLPQHRQETKRRCLRIFVLVLPARLYQARSNRTIANQGDGQDISTQSVIRAVFLGCGDFVRLRTNDSLEVDRLIVIAENVIQSV